MNRLTYVDCRITCASSVAPVPRAVMRLKVLPVGVPCLTSNVSGISACTSTIKRGSLWVPEISTVPAAPYSSALLVHQLVDWLERSGAVPRDHTHVMALQLATSLGLFTSAVNAASVVFNAASEACIAVFLSRMLPAIFS